MRQAEPQGNLVSRKAVINTLESMYNACDTNNCYDLYLLLKECYEVLPSAYSDIEAIYNAGYEADEVFAWSPLPKPYVKGET